MREPGGGAFNAVTEGLDPCLAVYAQAQAVVSIMVEQLATTKEAQAYARLVTAAEGTYMPSFPPMSPIMTSHFAMWSLFDLQFGPRRETIGTCVLRIAELAGVAAEVRTPVTAMQASRLGLYVHCGVERRFVRLRQIATEVILRCLVLAGYGGQTGEI